MAGGTDTRKIDYANKQKQSKASIMKLYTDLGLDVTVFAGNSGQTPNGYAWGLLNGHNPGSKPSRGSGPDNGSDGSGKNTEAFVYYYHPDHLGSSSYITDANGEVSQHVEYFAFGETFLEEHSNTDRTPYLYNGKELDEETGLYYYSARYYDAGTSVWKSVDPLAEEFPGWSPYNYTFNNPINLIDPTGMAPEDIRFRDKDGNLIATYYTDEFDDDVYLPVSAPETNINLNESLIKNGVGLDDLDAVGIGGEFDFTFVMGGGVSLEAMYFLDGKDQGTSELFKTKRQNVGMNGSVGVYGVFADFQGADKKLTTDDYKGRSFALSGGIKGPWLGGYSEFWAPINYENDKSGFKSLFNKNLRLWTGFTVGGGAGAGLQWSRQNTSSYKK